MQCKPKRHITWKLRRAGDERGQAVLETALITVVLLLLFAGAIDVGRMFYHYIAVTNAAREGARMASRLPCYPDVENSPNAVREAAIAAARNEASNAFGLMLRMPTSTLSMSQKPVFVQARVNRSRSSCRLNTKHYSVTS